MSYSGLMKQYADQLAAKREEKKIKKWYELTRPQKRVVVAKDVLKLLSQNSIDSEINGYLDVITDKRVRHSDQLNTSIKNGVVKCTACAKGALFIGLIMKENHCTISEAKDTGHTGIMERLTPTFSQLQLDMIETAFERGIVSDSTHKLSMSGRLTKLGRKCKEYGIKDETKTTTLVRILKNIIKNNGTFKP